MSGDNVFKHPEVNTMLLFVYTMLRARNYLGAVVQDSEDTDIYVHSAHVS